MADLRRNDLAQYDELAGQWWEASGGFAMLHWLAASRAGHIPPAASPGAILVDLACGGGLMAPYAARLGYRHVGVDLGLPGLRLAREHGVRAGRRGDVLGPRRGQPVQRGELAVGPPPLVCQLVVLRRIVAPHPRNLRHRSLSGSWPQFISE